MTLGFQDTVWCGFRTLGWTTVSANGHLSGTRLWDHVFSLSLSLSVSVSVVVVIVVVWPYFVFNYWGSIG